MLRVDSSGSCHDALRPSVHRVAISVRIRCVEAACSTLARACQGRGSIARLEPRRRHAPSVSLPAGIEALHEEELGEALA